MEERAAKLRSPSPVDNRRERCTAAFFNVSKLLPKCLAATQSIPISSGVPIRQIENHHALSVIFSIEELDFTTEKEADSTEGRNSILIAGAVRGINRTPGITFVTGPDVRVKVCLEKSSGCDMVILKYRCILRI